MSFISKHNTIPKILLKIYTGSVICAGITGSVYGVKSGYDVAKTICYKKNSLTSLEYFGEAFCFSGIILSGGLLCGMVSSFTVAIAPISIPTLYFIYIENKNKYLI